MAYVHGICPLCDTPIMLRDAFGRRYNKDKLFAQVYLYLENGPPIKAHVCKNCVHTNQHEKLLEAIIADGSQAQTPEVLAYIKTLGASVRMEGRA